MCWWFILLILFIHNFIVVQYWFCSFFVPSVFIAMSSDCHLRPILLKRPIVLKAYVVVGERSVTNARIECKERK